VAAVFAAFAPSVANGEIIDFQSDRWIKEDAEVVLHMDRTCLSGVAHLKDVSFTNGVIEVDIAMDGSRSYPGITFRVQSGENYERLYLRPHRAGLYPDAIQYTPVFNGVAGWQLYNGDGFTAGAEILADQWVHLKIEVLGSRARVYLDGVEEPALRIHDLKHGISEGSIGLMGPKNSSAYFSNFQYRLDDNLVFEEAPALEAPEGMITEWEVSKAFNAARVDLKAGPYPRFYTIFFAGWQPVESELSGLVNISRYAKRSGRDPDCVLARKIFFSPDRREIQLSFGYSDEASVFLNGKKVFYGNSAYRYRDPSFLGVIGLFDTAYLPLEKGLNEIFLIVKESFGGWGFMCQTNAELTEPVKNHERLSKVWETAPDFLTPESVLYDPKRDVLYVSSFDNRYDASATSEEQYTGYISRVSVDGVIEELKWVTNLHAPCGLGIYEDRLYTVERRNLTEIDIDSGKIVKRYPIPGADFMNDLIIDAGGNVYISDTSPSAHADSRIYRFKDGEVEVWTDSNEINRANGLFIHEDRLLVGNTGDGCLKSIGLADKHITTIACLGAGVVDGIRVDAEGNYLVSHWEGQTFVVTPQGEVTEILDALPDGLNTADFEFIREKNLLIIPTFVGNKVVAYRLM
jgi:sugar lactone lactonase YvrE